MYQVNFTLSIVRVGLTSKATPSSLDTFFYFYCYDNYGLPRLKHNIYDIISDNSLEIRICTLLRIHKTQHCIIGQACLWGMPEKLINKKGVIIFCNTSQRIRSPWPHKNNLVLISFDRYKWNQPWVLVDATCNGIIVPNYRIVPSNVYKVIGCNGGPNSTRKKNALVG